MSTLHHTGGETARTHASFIHRSDLPEARAQRVAYRLEDLEVAVSDESAALISYFDDLKSGIAEYNQELQNAIERRDYDTAELVSSERDTLRKVIAVDPNPGRKALIQDCLAAGIIDRLRDAEINEYVQPCLFA